jgi:hypothetical protein
LAFHLYPPAFGIAVHPVSFAHHPIGVSVQTFAEGRRSAFIDKMQPLIE